jgi:hypothetical protein
MLLAQAEPTVAASGIMDFAGKFGFPALLVLVLLYGIYKMLDAAKTEREKRDDRDEKREEARRVEREADRKAHVDALTANTASLNTLGIAVVETGHKVDSLFALREQEMRLVKGG